MKWSVIMSAVLAGTVLTVSGCAGEPSVDDASSAGSDTPTVVAAAYPLQFIAEQVVPDGVTVDLAVPVGAEPHDVELSPQEVLQIMNANVVFYIPGFQPSIDQAVEQKTEGVAVDVTQFVPPGKLREGDPHLWVSPAVMIPVVEGMGEAVEGLAGESGRVVSAERTASLVEKMTALDTDYENVLAQCAVKTIVVDHAAFEYMTSEYGLEEVSVVGMVPEANPSARALADTIRAIEDFGVTTIYAENQAGTERGIPVTLAEATGASIAVLSPLEVVPEGGDYLTGLAVNLDTLRAGQGCYLPD